MITMSLNTCFTRLLSCLRLGKHDSRSNPNRMSYRHVTAKLNIGVEATLLHWESFIVRQIRLCKAACFHDNPVYTDLKTQYKKIWWKDKVVWFTLLYITCTVRSVRPYSKREIGLYGSTGSYVKLKHPLEQWCQYTCICKQHTQQISHQKVI